MGSEENYLDNLLKSMENGAGASGRAPIIGDSVSYDDVATLTEDEMEKMIAQAASAEDDVQEAYEPELEESIEDVMELLEKEQNHELVDEKQIIFSQEVENMDSEVAPDADHAEMLMENDISELLSQVDDQVPTREEVEQEHIDTEKREEAEQKRKQKEEQKEKKRQVKLQKQRIKEEKKRQKEEKRKSGKVPEKKQSEEKQLEEKQLEEKQPENAELSANSGKANGFLNSLFSKKRKKKDTSTGKTDDNISADSDLSPDFAFETIDEEPVIEDAFQQSIQELLATDGFAEIDVNEVDPSTIIPDKHSRESKNEAETQPNKPEELFSAPTEELLTDGEETIDLSNLAATDNADIAELLREASELNEIGKENQKNYVSDLSEEDSEDTETVETENAAKEKKVSLWSKLMNFLFEEEEEEEEQISDAEDLPTGKVSDENQAILDAMEEEGKGKKKKKPKKEKKNKKGKGEEKSKAEGEEEPEEDEDSGKKSKGKKGKKEKKPKKEKVPEEEPANKLPKKKVRAVILFSISLLAILLLFCFMIPSKMETKEARQAYYDGKYEETYQAMYGKKLSSKDKAIFRKSGILLRMQRKLDTYHYYKEAGKETEALNALIQGVAKYYEVKDEAEELGIPNKVKKKYFAILELLHTEYNVPEYEAILVSELEDDVEYVKALQNITKGLMFDATSDADVREALEPLEPEEEIIEEDTEPEEEGNLLFQIFSK